MIIGLAILVFVVFLPLLIAMTFSYILGSWLMEPLDKVVPIPTPPTQFALTDIYVLVFQLFLAGLVIFSPPGRFDGKLTITVFLWPIIVWWWWLGVRSLCRARVTAGFVRAVNLLITVPLAYGVSVALTLGAGGVVALLCELFRNLPGGTIAILSMSLLALLWLGTYAVCRKLTQWAVASVQAHPGTH